jgi:DNA-binding NarL/FixJ family response regulator
MSMNFLKVTPASAMEVLQRLALHYPRSKQVAVLDLLADDYAADCRNMRQHEFEAAASRARSKSKYFPTSAHILEAWEEIKAEQRQEQAAQESRGQDDDTIPTDRAREVLEALKTGTKPGFMQ